MELHSMRHYDAGERQIIALVKKIYVIIYELL